MWHTVAENSAIIDPGNKVILYPLSHWFSFNPYEAQAGTNELGWANTSNADVSPRNALSPIDDIDAGIMTVNPPKLYENIFSPMTLFKIVIYDK